MGAAPSAEILQQAPFRPPHSSPRQIALIPLTKEYFPSPQCELFKQLYSARMDPSVRYYLRYPPKNGGEGIIDSCQYRQNIIPPINRSIEELYDIYLQSTSRHHYESNTALRADVEAGNDYRVRPVPCAVMFLYEGAGHMPEGSVRLLNSPNDTYVHIIGGIGDVEYFTPLSEEGRAPLSKSDISNIHMFITKSAGDHNMARVLLLAAYTYQHHCLDVIGLPYVPTLPTVFMSFKTNIPFLCFLRELRDRICTSVEISQIATMWLDKSCLRGFVDAEHAKKLIEACSQHYMQFMESKVQHRALKQQRHHQASLASKEAAAASTAADGTPVMPSSPLDPQGDMESQQNQQSTAATNNTIHSPGASITSNPTTALVTLAQAQRSAMAPKHKVDYIIKGYITRDTVIISAWSGQANEVYLVCVDSTVSVVDAEPKDITATGSGVTAVPIPEPLNAASSPDSSGGTATTVTVGNVCETLVVRRGDILTFRDQSDTPGITTTGDGAATAAAPGTNHLDSHPPSSSSSENHDDRSPAAVTSAAPVPDLHMGRWVADPSVYIENVLLALVRDECKRAREADPDDPHWVRSTSDSEPGAKEAVVHDGPFYIWHFHRGEEVFYYGTVPKFANAVRKSRQTGKGARSGAKGASAPQEPQGSAPAKATPQTQKKNGGSRPLLPATPSPPLPLPPPYSVPTGASQQIAASTSLYGVVPANLAPHSFGTTHAPEQKPQWVPEMGLPLGPAGTMLYTGAQQPVAAQAPILYDGQQGALPYSYVVLPDGHAQLVYGMPPTPQAQPQPTHIMPMPGTTPLPSPQVPGGGIIVNGQLYVPQQSHPKMVAPGMIMPTYPAATRPSVPEMYTLLPPAPGVNLVSALPQQQQQQQQQHQQLQHYYIA